MNVIWQLAIMLVFMFLLHLPIYRSYRHNKQNRKPPKIWEAVLLSFFPSPMGGILYVGGIVPALIGYALVVLVLAIVKFSELLAYFSLASVFALASGIWAYKRKKLLTTEHEAL